MPQRKGPRLPDTGSDGFAVKDVDVCEAWE